MARRCKESDDDDDDDDDDDYAVSGTVLLLLVMMLKTTCSSAVQSVKCKGKTEREWKNGRWKSKGTRPRLLLPDFSRTFNFSTYFFFRFALDGIRKKRHARSLTMMRRKFAAFACRSVGGKSEFLRIIPMKRIPMILK